MKYGGMRLIFKLYKEGVCLQVIWRLGIWGRHGVMVHD